MAEEERKMDGSSSSEDIYRETLPIQYNMRLNFSVF